MYDDRGSLNTAVNGEYNFRIGEVLSEAWERTNGTKLTFLAALFIYIVIAGLMSAAVSFLFDAQKETKRHAQSIRIFNTHVLKTKDIAYRNPAGLLTPILFPQDIVAY